MLVVCPECEGKVSDKAPMCPHCGYPMKKPQRTQSNYARLPNGFGTIKHLSGRRRKPFVCYPAVKSYTDKGSPIVGKAIGYFESYNQAYIALSDYNKCKPIVGSNSKTFEEVYGEWHKDKFMLDEKRTYSKSLINAYASAYKNCFSLHNKLIKDIRLADMQSIIDNCTLKHASQENIVHLLRQVFAYAMKYDYVEKDYSRYIKIRIMDNDEKGEPFTENELKVLWDNKSNEDVQIVLLMIYTGFRITELETLTLDKKERCFKGGLKTKAGKDRLVPIHDAVWDYAVGFKSEEFVAQSWRRRHFYKAMEELHLETAQNGSKHTPHDCRHTFSWLCDKYGVDGVSKHLIMGHALQGDVESKVYTHRTLKDLRTEIQKIKIE